MRRSAWLEEAAVERLEGATRTGHAVPHGVYAGLDAARVRIDLDVVGAVAVNP
ncbi:MAG: hypothetical protein R6W77_16325 [Trueperaceae bacterium]